MSTRVVTVRGDATVAVALDRLRRFGFSALPVVNARHRLVGVLSLLDVLRHRESGGDHSALVEDVMNPDVLMMPPTASPSVVAQRMRAHGELRVMPIVERGTLVGVVTRSDLLRPPRRRGRFDALVRRVTGRDDAADEVLLGLTLPGRERPAVVAATPARELMTTDVVTVAPGDPVELAVELLLERRFTALPVVDGDRLVGVVSEADLLGDRIAGRRGPRTVGAVMTRTPVSVPADATVGDVVALVAEQGLRMVPVVDGQALVGVLSRGDLV
ncbi:CBS domain-containing protein [Pseudonocardia sp. KRD-184]|uniref:CBS domain-containing protein n=1 Tax=Pseudonocardia oceani TaxID=2792013 RepID=A0ABS6U963_9PSEU|nr:CBS domain-containing protein [Pseudonocardia oceani]MBW0092139.1 CBS domain-containing protein [Pseudonocardia oceani]MBW0098029.1 CBS domain-containing protein [Pseudonocardia oceani]MBW0111620.1 CBS domain-containing protein [Pseudonocardia oceani]MBW0124019.1 CBS domain-containing protein [Pseudonocardia oceani]MBW0128689.1 CBS domain-containing protein [Pseudonocardia oceani]